ncbi:probable RNA polymerase II transcription factor B subunit 3 [Saccharomycodes ludwigii]|uniref:RNA polymerase II transcription factor B subunit 3 n=1 Tax=Saccharomycodes ludwigii TaxID=36035 RepID=A0A376B3I2_9ASCO|nr:hypothetical protein SCDLUD_004920 [Saccharomycodes ludwigii]KAH3899476.1 hypothetical protein SCDLUD_004920 [Saccharomycodes ludwigii]SSD59246.1 probable RNA polymerase II transcription factor B subunit 3 [Saccharomycodes ludwigii]
MDEEEKREMCPICKTDRYLSPDMKFLVNPECYHKICESCVDRIFSLGPAQCPYEGCDKILRRNKFKTQVFDDVDVEKEVDIRKRVFNVFNKTLEDFDGDENKYNAYLEEVEDIIYNLDNGIDLKATEEKVKTYEDLNRQLILANIERTKQDLKIYEKREQFQKEMKLKKKLLEKQIEQEEKNNQEWAKREIVDQLSAGNDTSEVINNVKKTVKLKKSSARRKLEELNKVLKSNPYSMISNGVLKRQEPRKVPFTPFNGDRDLHKRYALHEDKTYYDPFIKQLQTRKDYIASGFEATLVYDRMLTEAFTGLGCFIQEELSSS